MKKFFSLIVAGALMAGIVAIAPGQGAGPKSGGVQGGPKQPGGPGGQGGRQGNRVRFADLMKKIQPPLTADQTTKIEAINKKSREEMQKLRGAGSGPGGPPRNGAQGGPPSGQRPDMSKFMDIMKKRNEAINKVLTKKQQESFKKLTADMMKRFQQGRGGGGRPGGPPPPGGKAGGGKGG
jgi:Spy/CpxP family protein refolding chaperone